MLLAWGHSGRVRFGSISSGPGKARERQLFLEPAIRRRLSAPLNDIALACYNPRRQWVTPLKVTISAEPYTTFAELEQVARNVSGIALVTDSQLPLGRLEIERTGDLVRWRLRDQALEFPVSAISALFLSGADHGPNRHLAATIEFNSEGGPKAYRMLIGHESKANWVRSALSELAALFGTPADDRPI